MKKFLFTLAALMLAGTAFAGRIYVEDVEFTADQIGNQQLLPLYIELDNEYVNGWEITITYPEGVTAGNPKKNTAVLNQMIPNADGDDEMVTPLGDCTANKIVQVYGTAGYWDPEDDGEFESYGAVKIGPTGTFKLYDLRVTPNEGFTGGTIVIEWIYSGGFDLRNGQTKVQAEGTTEVSLTVEGGTVEPEVTEKPVITTEEVENGVKVVATGNGHICLYVEDILVAEGEGTAEYVIESTELEEEYGVSATAQEEGKEVSEYAVATVYVPAAVVVPEVTEKPVITVTVDEDAQTVTITATGNGTVILYNDDVEVARGEGVAEYVVPFTEDPEGEEMGFSATAQEEGKEVSEYALATVEIPGKPAVQPEVTEAPVVTYEVTDDAVIITATGAGEVVLYVNDEAVENPYTIARPEAGEEDITIFVYATAQEEGKEMGTSDVEPIVVEAQEGGEVPPVDPHAEGYWLVTYDMDGNEIWTELTESNGDYNVILRCSYGVYGTFDYYGGETRPDIVYYIVVDGVRYGAAVDGTLTVLGEALQNPLTEGENNYVLSEGLGKVYNMGVAIDEMTGDMYVYAAVAGFTEIDEMNAGKAVAGVRYFNMAGQEMQEANGMTIVVTTYTDGTTSAVKVMK